MQSQLKTKASAILSRGRSTATRTGLIMAATLIPLAASAQAGSTATSNDPTTNYATVDTQTSAYVVGLVQGYGVKFIVIAFAMTGLGVVWKWSKKAFH